MVCVSLECLFFNSAVRVLGPASKFQGIVPSEMGDEMCLREILLTIVFSLLFSSLCT